MTSKQAVRPGGAEFAAAVAAVIRVEMARSEIRRRGLAEAAEIGYRPLGRCLTNRVPFDLGQVERIADVFGVTVTELLARAEAAAAVQHLNKKSPDAGRA